MLTFFDNYLKVFSIFTREKQISCLAFWKTFPFFHGPTTSDKEEVIVNECSVQTKSKQRG